MKWSGVPESTVSREEWSEIKWSKVRNEVKVFKYEIELFIKQTHFALSINSILVVLTEWVS